MKYLSALVLLLLFAGCGDQPGTDPAINIPADGFQGGAPDLTAAIDRANQEVCRANMQMAANNILMYQATNGTLPESLGEASSVPARCPEDGEFIYTVENGSWRLECPAEPSHGAVEDGVPLW